MSRGARDANADIMSVHKQSEVFSISPRSQFMLTISFPRRHILCEGDGERELGIEIIALNCTQVLDAKIKNGQLIGKVRLFPPVGRLQLGGVVFLFSNDWS